MKSIFRDLHDEPGASRWVKSVLDEQNWDYQTEAAAGEGRIDYLVKAPQCSFGIEVKRDLHSEQLTMTNMADYFEGPVIVNQSTPSAAYAGGTTADALSAFNIFGGRVNIGTLIYFRGGYPPSYWAMILRGGLFWSGHPKHRHGFNDHGFNPKKLSFVSSTGSKKEREPL